MSEPHTILKRFACQYMFFHSFTLTKVINVVKVRLTNNLIKDTTMIVTIKIEGEEGSGKSLLSQFIKEALSEHSEVKIAYFRDFRRGCLPDVDNEDTLKIEITDFEKFVKNLKNGVNNG